MVKSRGLLRQLLAARPFGLGILKSWMDLCQLPWIANPHPTPHRTAPVSSHSSSDRFLAVTSIGCFQQRSHGVYQKCRGPTYKFVLQYGTICVPQTTVPDLLNSNRVIPRPITPPKKDGKNQGKTLGIPGSEGYSTVAPHHPCIFFHPQLKIRWMDDLWYLDMWSNNTICNSKGRSSVALRRRRCKRCWAVWNPSWGM